MKLFFQNQTANKIRQINPIGELKFFTFDKKFEHSHK